MVAAAIRKPWHPPLGPRVGRAHAREKLCPQGLANLALPPWPLGHFFLAARRRSGRSLALLAVSLLALPALAQSTVRIQGCSDGATCRTAEGEIIRIACIDPAAFAGAQADRERAEAARDYLQRLVVGQDVLIRRIGQDRYGRRIAELYLWPWNIGEEMVASGHARILQSHDKQCPWALL